MTDVATIRTADAGSSGFSRLKRRLEATAKLFSASTAPRILPTVPWNLTVWFPAAAIAEIMYSQAAGFATYDEAMEAVAQALTYRSFD